jgi:uncharacterized circularly permuted ATP-grasp superfamily protein
LESARVLKQKPRSLLSRPYDPNLGYIGRKRVKVPNYLFRSRTKGAHGHARGLARSLLSRSVEEHYRTSHRLTRFIRDRGLTFQKSGSDGLYRIFTVPVTSSVVPLPESVFRDLEQAARMLLISLRKVLQSVYGSPSLPESPFVHHLPSGVRGLFVDACLGSPHYIPQLHHPVMNAYPFLDQVGLDLVLVEEYVRGGAQLPFRLLELNAGSPSGASNNMSILEGLLREDPAMLDSLGPVLPNDHFRILRETYESLGRGWTGRADGIQVILPPGGENGATPEIHQLARLSGLRYCEAGQLYPSEDGWIRVRTLDGLDPVVTAVYSRVNSDSALFDLKRGIHLRDPDSGRPLYCLDTLKPWNSGKPELLRDRKGRPVPLESGYAIPGCVDAIHSRRLYLGGLNRLLDNKMILSLLLEHAPRFARSELDREELRTGGCSIQSPEELPPVAVSVERIEARPEDWVVKAPNLSGGTGVHILLSLDEAARRRVLAEIRRNPGSFAYQRVVRIARIPVAVRSSPARGYRFANRAADVRMWMFYGTDGELPRLTRNALVRFAPEDKGPLSSIVNTSKGGGYAPFVVVDDIEDGNSIPARDLAIPPSPIQSRCGIPAFAAAQILRMADWVEQLRGILESPEGDAGSVFDLLDALGRQMRDVASFFDPDCSVVLSSLLAIAGRGSHRERRAARACAIESLQTEWVSSLPAVSHEFDPEGAVLMEGLRCLDPEVVWNGIVRDEEKMLRSRLRTWIHWCKDKARAEPGRKRDWLRLERIARDFLRIRWQVEALPIFQRRRMGRELSRFRELAREALQRSGAGAIAGAFESGDGGGRCYREPGPWSGLDMAPRYASEWEWKNGRLLVDSDFVDPQVRKVREEWLQISAEIAKAPEEERAERLVEARFRHQRRHPELARLQQLIELGRNGDPEVLLPVMRYLPYAGWNLEAQAQALGLRVQDLFRSRDPGDVEPSIRIRLLDHRGLRLEGLAESNASGECFIRKRSPHGLLSEGNCFLWVAMDQSPFTQAYTLGHELIHAVQLRDLMEQERTSRRAGDHAFASFLRDYGLFHATAARVREEGVAGAQARTPLYGLPDRMVSQFFSPVIRELRASLSESRGRYQEILHRYGGWFGAMMPVPPAVRVKALREVFPALENLKNLLFASECGLELNQDPVAAALPTANRAQLRALRAGMLDLARNPRPGAESLRRIASYQLYGVGCPLSAEGSPLIPAGAALIRLGQAYNQTEQQQ